MKKHWPSGCFKEAAEIYYMGMSHNNEGPYTYLYHINQMLVNILYMDSIKYTTPHNSGDQSGKNERKTAPGRKAAFDNNGCWNIWQRVTKWWWWWWWWWWWFQTSNLCLFDSKRFCFIIVYHFIIFIHVFYLALSHQCHLRMQKIPIFTYLWTSWVGKFLVTCVIVSKYNNHHHYHIKGTLFTFRNNPIWTIFVAFKMLKRKTLHFDLPRHLCLGGWGIGEIHIPRWCLLGSSQSNPENGWCLAWCFFSEKTDPFG